MELGVKFVAMIKEVFFSIIVLQYFGNGMHNLASPGDFADVMVTNQTGLIFSLNATH